MRRSKEALTAPTICTEVYSIEIAVFDHSNSDDSIISSHWRLLEDDLAKIFTEVMVNHYGPAPVYQMCG